MNINTRGPIWASPDKTLIDCEIEHPVYGWVPFTASPNDVEVFGREVFNTLKQGTVAPYPVKE